MILRNIVFFCLKTFFTFTNSVDPDEIQHYAAFHQGLHFLQNYSFVVSRIQRVKDKLYLTKKETHHYDFSIKISF